MQLVGRREGYIAAYHVPRRTVVVEIDLPIQQHHQLGVLMLMRRMRHLAGRKGGVVNIEQFSIGELAG